MKNKKMNFVVLVTENIESEFVIKYSNFECNSCALDTFHSIYLYFKLKFVSGKKKEKYLSQEKSVMEAGLHFRKSHSKSFARAICKEHLPPPPSRTSFSLPDSTCNAKQYTI